MNQTSEVIRRLLDSHFRGDDVGFRDAAWDLVRRERSLKHNILADELERILAAASPQDSKAKSFLRTLSPSNGNLPKDKDKNANLIELSDPVREMGDLVLAPALRARLDRVIAERRGADLLHSHGMQPISKLLYCGPPGCGKTVAAEAMAKELYLPLATVRFDAVVSSYLGETAANLRKVFEFARLRPMLLLFDEFDAIGKHRTAFDEHGELKRVVNSFLQLLDGFHSETLTIAATNHQGLLDRLCGGVSTIFSFFPNRQLSKSSPCCAVYFPRSRSASRFAYAQSQTHWRGCHTLMSSELRKTPSSKACSTTAARFGRTNWMPRSPGRWNASVSPISIRSPK
jgi:hypothetical protein